MRVDLVLLANIAREEFVDIVSECTASLNNKSGKAIA
jgi:hypothetical protein